MLVSMGTYSTPRVNEVAIACIIQKRRLIETLPAVRASGIGGVVAAHDSGLLPFAVNLLTFSCAGIVPGSPSAVYMAISGQAGAAMDVGFLTNEVESPVNR
jgi:hypothetical protein